MDVLVMDTSFQGVGILDVYESLIWTDRFDECGDFEIYTPVNTAMLSLLQKGYYLWSSRSEHLMIIEGIQTDTDVEDGDKLIVTGRSLESILDRRVVWVQTTFSTEEPTEKDDHYFTDTNLQNAVKVLITDAFISPSDPSRKIDNFVFEDSDDEIFVGKNALRLEAQYNGDNLYDAITSICQENNIGFQITLNDNNQFVFKLCSGKNRSYNQNEHNFVIFSPHFDNLANSSYLDSNKTLKNVARVEGEKRGNDTITYWKTVGDTTGLDRREVYVDGTSISHTHGQHTLSDEAYYLLLSEKGEEELANNKKTETLDCEIEDNGMFTFGTDFFLGDVVQVLTEHGIEGKCRVTEMIQSIGDSEFKFYPTFEVITEPWRIIISQTALNFTERGQTAQLSAYWIPEDISSRVYWTSSDEGVATVDSNGLVTCVYSGKCTITATAGSVKATCNVTFSTST
jgi:hypothetical protein